MHFTYTLGPFYKRAVKHMWNWPKALGLIVGSTQNADEENTWHKTQKHWGVMWVLCWHRKGEHPLPGVMDAAPSQGQPACHRDLSSLKQPGPSPEPLFLQLAQGKAENREWLEGNCSASSYPPKWQWKSLALGLSGRSQSSWPYSTQQ